MREWGAARVEMDDADRLSIEVSLLSLIAWQNALTYLIVRPVRGTF